MIKYFILIILTINSIGAEVAYVQNKLIVKFNTSASKSDIKNTLKDSGFYINQHLVKQLNIWSVDIDSKRFTNTVSSLEKIRTLPNVIYAQLDHRVTQRLMPNDPDFSQMWDMHNTGQNGGSNDADIDAPEAWDITTGGMTALGDEIVVAVVDGGVQTSHTDLAANIWVNENEIPGNGIDDDGNGYVDDINGWDAFSNDGSIPSDSHGTHVAGTVGAVGDNGQDVVGVNWNVKLMCIAGATSSTSTISIAYGYVLDQKALWLETNGEYGANVVATNSSFGIDYADCNSGSYPVWNDLYNSMGEVGILSAAATINANQNVDVIGDVPTGCNSDYIISVTNTTNNDVKYSSAGYGATTIDLGAPGTNICSTVPTNSTSCSYTGTSMATPHVAGAVGFLHAAASVNLAQLCIDDPGNCALTLKQALLDNVDPLSSLSGNTVSGGRLNLFQSASAISGPQPYLEISMESISFNLTTDQVGNDNIVLSNIGEAESNLIFSIEKTPFNQSGGGNENLLFWSDSDLENAIDHEWVDIAGYPSTSTQIIFPSNDSAGDPIELPFEFPFFGVDDPNYGTPYTQCIVNANGWLGFSNDHDYWDNTSLPSQSAPANAIFPFWDDLNPVNENCNQYCSGDVWHYGDEEKFVVWFNNVAHWWTNNENSFYNFQVVLYPSGEIQFNYAEITGTHSATIGFQNNDGSAGVLVNFNGDYVHNDLTTKFKRGPEWLNYTPISGEILEGETTVISVQASSDGLVSGNYSGYLNINSNGGSGTVTVLMDVENGGSIVLGDINLDGSINIQDIILMVNIILDILNPTPDQFEAADLNADGIINVLDVIALVNIILDN